MTASKLVQFQLNASISREAMSVAVINMEVTACLQMAQPAKMWMNVQKGAISAP
jgi:hypothetical protein